jgi:hypothetical protein
MLNEKEVSKVGKSIEIGNRLVVPGVNGEWGVTADGCGFSFWGDENALKLGVMVVH